MTIICVSATIERIHGFLRSVMLNPHPGVYVSSQLSRSVQNQIWAILVEWFQVAPVGTIVMITRKKGAPLDLEICTLGAPRRMIREMDGQFVIERQ